MLAESRQKPKVVVDTNVFVSALNFRGKPREVLDLIRKGEIELYISPFILGEMEKVLEEDFNWDKEQIRNAAERIRNKAIEVHPKVNLSAIKEKEADNRILECAVEGRVQYIVSGDKRHLLPLEQFEGVKILPPADFLKTL